MARKSVDGCVDLRNYFNILILHDSSECEEAAMSDFMLWLEEKGIIEDTAYALEYYSAARLEAITDIYMDQYLASIVNDDIVLPEIPC